MKLSWNLGKSSLASKYQLQSIIHKQKGLKVHKMFPKDGGKDYLSKPWHEQFGHLNYRSLQQLCKYNMVTSLPMVSCKDGVCFGCVVRKHHRDSFDKCASWHASVPLELVWSSSICFLFWFQIFLNFHS